MTLETAAKSNNLLPLPDAERHFIHNLLSDAAQDLGSVDIEVDRTRSALDGRLLHVHAEKVTDIAVAPHRTLPPELLAKMFIHCMEDELGGPILLLPQSAGSLPWTLGHICSRWRQIVLQEPTLWNNISITYHNSTHIPAMMKEALFRSAEASLSISIYSHPSRNGPHDENPLPTMILPYIHRLRTLSLFVSAPSIRQFLSEVSESPPALKVIEFWGDGNIEQTLRETKMFENASNLRKLLLKSIHNYVPLSVLPSAEDIPVPWAQLTHLELAFAFMSPDTAHNLLRVCSNLQECRFKIGSSQRGVVPTDTVVVPHLRRLQFEVETVSASCEFIRPLLLPSLTALDEGSLEERGLSYSSLLSLIRRSRCEITELRMKGPSAPDQDLERLLEAVPKIRDLAIFSPLSSAVVMRIATRQLAPKLQIVECYVNGVPCRCFEDICGLAGGMSIGGESRQA
ncbi:hypothetical protein Hypma_011248 [Hypsizygus marmoreus]|uniref:Uncharacterized protein n=1 Tax=Hypsizygus marmoreus TaxID=39966 RepID=A0A369JHB5_HYPMA|nr:hypothetical protein Hypma_011248 [Hypsizygus marmoreus]